MGVPAVAQLACATFLNFRTLREATVPFRTQTVLVGPNNVGKSSVLQALEAALGVGRRGFGFGENDISDGADPAQGFEILLTVVPSAGEPKFTTDEIATFGFHVDVGDPNRQRVFLRVVGRIEEDGQFRSRMRFEKADGIEDGAVGIAERELLGFLLLPAVREARREFYERSGLWAKIGAANEVSPEVVDELAELGRRYGETVVDKLLGPAIRGKLTDAVAGTLSSVLYADQATPSVAFTLLPHDAEGAMQEVELQLATPGQAAAHRVSAHSVGTQSVAVVGLFSAYLDSVKDKLLGLGFEEPEAHLHPQATRALVRRLLDSNAPTILTTHSTAVTDAADPRSIVVLRPTPTSTVAKSVPEGMLTDSEAHDVRRRMAEAGSEFLFARVVLLAEGPSERLAMPVFAKALGHDLDILGVSIAPVGGGSFKHFLKLLGPAALDIPHLVICDNDAAATTLISHLRELGRLPTGVTAGDLQASRKAMCQAGYYYWGQGALEGVLLDAGAAPLFVEAIEEIWPGRLDSLLANWGGTDKDDKDFLKRALHDSVSKPQVARLVAEKMIAKGNAVPAEIKELLDAVATRARSEAKPPDAAPANTAEEPGAAEPAK
jgi:putative ATP-dependent endonuclease of OLD family